MTNGKRRAKPLPRVLRAGMIAAAMTAVLAVTAGAADMASGGVLFRSLREVWSDGFETHYEAVDQEGNEIMLSVSAGARIEKREDGRVMVLCAAGEEVDITERMAEDGRYHFEKSTESRSVEVDVTGSPETWELTETVTENGGVTYTNRLTSDDAEAAFQSGVTVAVDGGLDQDGVMSSSSVTVTSKGVEDVATVVTERGVGSIAAGEP